MEFVCAFTESTPLYDVPFRTTSTLEHFTPVTVEEVDKLIGDMPCKTCQLNPVPTWLVNELRELISPSVSLLMNKSLANGCFPSIFKRAVVCPLLKKRAYHCSFWAHWRAHSGLPISVN